MASYYVLTMLRRGRGKPARPGEMVELDEDEGEALVKIGALRPADQAGGGDHGEGDAPLSSLKKAKEQLELAGYIVMTVDQFTSEIMQAAEAANKAADMLSAAGGEAIDAPGEGAGDVGEAKPDETKPAPVPKRARKS